MTEEERKKRHKKEGGQRHLQIDHSVIHKRDAKLHITGRDQYLAQEKARRQAEMTAKIDKLGAYR